MAFIAGTYYASYGNHVLGDTEDGFHLREIIHHEPIHTDAGGMSLVDGIQQGADYIVTLTYMDYDLIAAALADVYTFGSPYENIGKTLLSMAAYLTLTPNPGTPAATAGTFYIPKAIVLGDVERLLSSRLRKGPISFYCLPDPANSDKAIYIL